jgi:NADH:ubiquinone oxidoreductase subunit E
MPGGSDGFYGTEMARETEVLDERLVQLVDRFLEENPGGRERLIPLLHEIQRAVGYLPFTIQEYVGEKLAIPPVQVYGVVSFYHSFTTTPRGRCQLKVCTGTACFVRGSQRLLEVVSREAGAPVGGVSPDRAFNLDSVRCIGACGLAPAIMIDDQVHGNMDPLKIRRLLDRERARAAVPEASHEGRLPEEDEP